MLSSQGNRTVKVDPLPMADCTWISPPCQRAMPCATDKPRPTPWCRRESLLSSCSKGSKIRFNEFEAMPGPVSVMRMSTMPGLKSGSYFSAMETSPLVVNLQALIVKLYNICAIFCESPRTTGKREHFDLFASLTPGLRRGFPALSTAALVMLTTSWMTSMTLTGLRGAVADAWRSRVEASIMLLIRSRSRSAQPWIMLSCFFCILSLVDSTMAPERPMMPCSGLRSSWDTIDSNRAWRSSKARCATSSVRSCPTTMILDVSVPNCIMKLTKMVTDSGESPSGFPAPAMGKDSSTPPVLRPALHCFRAFSTQDLLAGSTKSWNNFPTAQCSEMHVASARCSFQPVMRPSQSMDSMRALAFRMRRAVSSFVRATCPCSVRCNRTRSCQFRSMIRHEDCQVFSMTSLYAKNMFS
mmetsp:Transcript_47738/g.139177  ORF Transcript_47738/g.139177 Transcript_47738/m.139177 type:complete len:412 (-) Transcript_47738:821-2056(-)